MIEGTPYLNQTVAFFLEGQYLVLHNNMGISFYLPLSFLFLRKKSIYSQLCGNLFIVGLTKLSFCAGFEASRSSSNVFTPGVA